MRKLAFAGLVLALAWFADMGVASADPNAPVAHVTIRKATSNCKDPGAGPPPPSSGFACTYALGTQNLNLALNKPVETTLPDGRQLQLVFTGFVEGRFKVNGLSKRAGGAQFLPFATISARPNEPFGVHFPYTGSPNDALFVDISIN